MKRSKYLLVGYVGVIGQQEGIDHLLRMVCISLATRVEEMCISFW